MFYEKDVPYYAKHRDLDSCEYCDLMLYSNWKSVRANALRQASDSDGIELAEERTKGAD